VLRSSRYDKTAAISSPQFTWQILSLGSMEHRQRSQQINTSYGYLRLQPAYATIAFSHKEERECDKPAAEVIYAVVCMEGHGDLAMFCFVAGTGAWARLWRSRESPVRLSGRGFVDCARRTSATGLGVNKFGAVPGSPRRRAQKEYRTPTVGSMFDAVDLPLGPTTAPVTGLRTEVWTAPLARPFFSCEYITPAYTSKCFLTT
jgi:hypothetical protein